MSIKLISIDLDETLLNSDKTYDTERFEQLVNKLDQQGTMVMVVTGNSYGKIPDYFNEALLDKLYFACDNGTYIMHQNKLVKRSALEPKTQAAIAEFLTEIPDMNVFFSNGENVRYIAHDDAFVEQMGIFNPGSVPIEDISDLGELIKITIHTDQGLSYKKRLSRIINERHPEATAVTSGGGFMDVISRDGGKGMAVQFIQERYNIKPEESMAIGDSLNDESMFQVSGYAVAMENADSDLLMSSNYQIGNNNDQAVVKLLDEIVHHDSMEFMEKYRIDG